ncbi:anti-sigma factor family protein [Hyalangium sp.]|uniref:anti-sigma factor family protein n=1 Tax=Hyalangium sp. TaxID=2028555 RepID=UPI002D6B768B|nr:zf-HC2 domain-containing protein [Hyalangium sp.]HYH95133.1 zf-HC2 domain-containing protein [Hyalangium sp.]
MSCAFEEELTAYVDGELPSARRTEVEAHLGTCAECRSTETLLRHTLASLAALPEFKPSADTRRAVLAKVDALPLPLRERLKALLRPSVLMPSLGLAAVVGLAVVYTGSEPQGLDVTDAGALELAANLELVEDYDIVGLDSSEDLEVIEHLHELEVQ